MDLDKINESTEIISGHENAIKKIVEILYLARSRIDFYLDSYDLNTFLTNNVIMKTFTELKAKGIHINCISQISENSSPVRKIISIVDDFRHVDKINGSFIITDAYCIISSTARSTRPKKQVIVSNIHSLVQQQRQLFDVMWDKAIPADDKIKEIQEGKALELTETIPNSEKTLARVWEMLGSASEEILGLFSTANAFVRQERAGSVEILKELCKKRQDLKAKILTPRSKHVEELRSELKQFNIDVKYIQEFSQTKISMLIVDRKCSLVVELKDDALMDPLKAVGLSTYSTRIMSVLSYVSIFESYWTLSELHEESVNELAYTKEYLNKVLNEMDTAKKGL